MMFIVTLLVAASPEGGVAEAPSIVREVVEGEFLESPSFEEGHVRFRISTSTDVEVAILDADENVVRHLYAGITSSTDGRYAIRWDGRDDTGAVVRQGPLRARVRIGSQPALDRYVGYRANSSSDYCVGITVGRQGEVYLLLTNQTYGRTEVRVLDRNGKYLRTIVPYSANTPESRLTSVGRLEVDGERMPVVFNAHAHSLSPLMAGMTRQSMLFSKRGHLVLASALGTITNHGPPRHLLALDPHGGAPEGVTFVGPRFMDARGFLGGAGERGITAYDGLAQSPDGLWIYGTNSAEHWRQEKNRKHGVWRTTWDDESAQWFIGDDQLLDPQGLATDAAGNLYVCDRGHDRIVIFDPEGQLRCDFAVDSPQQIAVKSTTGEIYVVSRGRGLSHKLRASTLRKFTAWKPGETPKSLLNEEFKGETIEVFALDSSHTPTRIWMCLCVGWRAYEVVPFDETGDELQRGEPLFQQPGLDYPLFAHVDRRQDRLYVSQWQAGVTRVDLKSDKVQSLFERPGANEAVPGIDGTLYVTRGWQQTMVRTDADGRPQDFGTNGKLGPWEMGLMPDGKRTAFARSKGPHVGDRGYAVAPNGDLYLLIMSQYGSGRVDVYDPHGNLKREGLISGIPHGSSGIGVDASGNVYLGVNVSPLDGPRLPHHFEKAVPDTTWKYWRGKDRGHPWRYPYFNTYLYHWGSVVKFPSTGGRFHVWGGEKDPTSKPANLPSAATEYHSGYFTHGVAVEGARWRYAGCGPVPTLYLSWGDPACTCTNSRLAVDPYGRVFVPDVFRFSVEMIDTHGNQLGRIGRYGNVDDHLIGDQPRFAWPAFVSASDDHIYVSDSVNRRVAVIRIEYSATAHCDIVR